MISQAMNINYFQFENVRTSHLRQYSSPTLVAKSQWSQGSSIFPEQSRGKQCTTIALTSLAVAKFSPPPRSWSMELLDKIMLRGDRLYNSLDVDNDYLSHSDLPHQIDLQEYGKIDVNIPFTYFGILNQGLDDFESNTVTLENALRLCQNYTCLLYTSPSPRD